MLIRHSMRGQYDIRESTFIPEVARYADGSCVVKIGHTHVLCVVTLQEKSMQNIFFFYDMLPSAMRAENRPLFDKENKIFLEQACHTMVCPTFYHKYSLRIECHVLQNDGSIISAAISGLSIALKKALQLDETAFIGPLVGMTCGIVKDQMVLDIDLEEEIQAAAVALFIFTPQKQMIMSYMKNQKAVLSTTQWSQLVDLGEYGAKKLFESQNSILQAA